MPTSSSLMATPSSTILPTSSSLMATPSSTLSTSSPSTVFTADAVFAAVCREEVETTFSPSAPCTLLVCTTDDDEEEEEDCSTEEELVAPISSVARPINASNCSAFKREEAVLEDVDSSTVEVKDDDSTLC